MKHFLSIISCLSGLYLCSCTDSMQVEREAMRYKGVSRFNEEARGFIIKDTISRSFSMIDNYGITDDFVINSSYYNYKFLSYSGLIDNPLEQFVYEPHSLLNNFYFTYKLLAGKNTTNLMIDLPYLYDPMVYDLSLKKVTNTSGPIAEIKFSDEMEVRGIVYKNIIEIDFSMNQEQIKKTCPVKTYYSLEKGLIKFIRKDGIFFERI